MTAMTTIARRVIVCRLYRESSSQGRENIRESPVVRIRDAVVAVGVGPVSGTVSGAGGAAVRGSSVARMLAWSVVGDQLQFDHRRRFRLRSEGLGGDVELAGVLAGDDHRQRVLGIP